MMLELIEAVSGRLIGPKNCLNFLNSFEQFSDSPRTVWEIGGIN